MCPTPSGSDPVNSLWPRNSFFSAGSVHSAPGSCAHKLANRLTCHEPLCRLASTTRITYPIRHGSPCGAYVHRRAKHFHCYGDRAGLGARTSVTEPCGRARMGGWVGADFAAQAIRADGELFEHSGASDFVGDHTCASCAPTRLSRTSPDADVASPRADVAVLSSSARWRHKPSW